MWTTYQGSLTGNPSMGVSMAGIEDDLGSIAWPAASDAARRWPAAIDEPGALDAGCSVDRVTAR
jgi:hypothetical protein